MFWYHGPDKPMTPGVKIEILHPGDDIGNGLVRHCHFPCRSSSDARHRTVVG